MDDHQFRYVYILRSIPYPNRRYVGITNDLRLRLHEHNGGHSRHTRKCRPWRLETAIALNSRAKAAAFEKYLKTHSGRAFAGKHF